MNTKLLTGTIGAILLLSPLTYAQDQKPSPAKTTQAKSSGMSGDMSMSQAIAWEHAKDRAAARQARIEDRRSSSDRDADRTIDDKDTGRTVKDTKAPGA